jgi:hypothetical protein
MRTYENYYLKVELFNEQPHKDEVNLIKVSSKAIIEKVNIWGTDYDIIPGVTVDASDYIRSYDGAEFEIFGYQPNDESIIIEESRITIEYGLARKGFAPDETFYPPKQMYYSPSVEHFYLSLYSGETLVTIQGLNTQSQAWETVYEGKGLMETDLHEGTTGNLSKLRIASSDCLNAEIEYEGIFTQQFMEQFKARKSDYCDFYYIDLLPFRCGVKYELLQWTGENGTQKSFWFEKSETVRAWEQSVLLQTLNDNYAPLKNRLRNLTLQMNDLTASDMNYLADICYSDEVYIYRPQGNEQVFIADKSITVSESENKTQNFKITVNWKKYDTV